MGKCLPPNLKENSCDDVGVAGVAYKASTGMPDFEKYIPAKWMGTEGRLNVVDGTVEYDAVPVYEGLEWTPCNDHIDCAHRADITGARYYTGIISDHRYSVGQYRRKVLPTNLREKIYGFNCRSMGASCAAVKGKRNEGLMGCPQMYCQGCWASTGRCMSGTNVCIGGGSQLCATGMKSGCERIGSVNGSVTAMWDASRKFGEGHSIALASLANQTEHFKGETHDHGRSICSYRMDAMHTEDDLRKYIQLRNDKKIPTNAAFHDPLMAAMCSRVKNTALEPGFSACLPVYAAPGSTAQAHSTCSNFRAAGFVGEECRWWLKDLFRRDAEAGNGASYDTVLERLCGSRPDLAECACVNRRNNATYMNMIEFRGELAQGNEYCWLAVCRKGLDHGMLLDSSVAAYDIGGKTCKSNFCGNVIDYVDSHQNAASDVSQVTTCSTAGGGSDDGDGGGGVVVTGPGMGSDPAFGYGDGRMAGGGSSDGNGSSSSSSSSMEPRTIIGYAVGGVAALLLIAFVGRRLMSDGDSSSSKTKTDKEATASTTTSSSSSSTSKEAAK